MNNESGKIDIPLPIRPNIIELTQKEVEEIQAKQFLRTQDNQGVNSTK